jgi:hypothetical protein
LACAALAVRTLWLPLGRHAFDGHEADYLSAFLGATWTGSTRLYPLLAGAYALLGRVWAHPGVLLGINLLAGVATVLAGAWWVRSRWGDRAGAAAGLALVLSPAHVFWSASAYNVAIPQALVVAGLAWGGWGGAVLYALACANRIELVLLAPALVLLRERRVALGAIGALAALPLLEHTAQFHPPERVWSANLQMMALLGPLGEPVGLVLVALATTRRSWRLVLAALWVHVSSSAFDDYGYRHALFGGMCLAAAVSVGQGWRRWLVLPALGWLAWGTQDMAARFYLPLETFSASLADLGPPPECTEIMDDPLASNSHWNWRRNPPAGTLCWGEERIHRAWTSRSLHARALRMHTLYDLEPLGILRLPGGPRLVYEVRW